MALASTPQPSVEASTIEVTQSITDLVISVSWSPEIPLSSEPTIAIAPIQTVKDAERNPFTKLFARYKKR